MIEIKITGSTPLEALASLTAFGLRCVSNTEVHDAAERILAAETYKEAKEAAKPAAPAHATTLSHDPAPAMDQDDARAMVAAAKSFNPESAPANPQSPADLPPEPYVEEPPHGAPAPEPPKLEAVREIGLAAARKHGQPAVKAILESFGASSMSTLAADDRAAFLEKLAELEGPGEGDA